MLTEGALSTRNPARQQIVRSAARTMCFVHPRRSARRSRSHTLERSFALERTIVSTPAWKRPRDPSGEGRPIADAFFQWCEREHQFGGGHGSVHVPPGAPPSFATQVKGATWMQL
jgi:hypothetical protein